MVQQTIKADMPQRMEPWLNKKNEKRMPDDFKYLENDFIVLWKFLTQGKEVSKTFGRIKIGCVLGKQSTNSPP